ncbi:hypothetical protein jhhlp_003642 [Lomentospora prolificans]|uniref:Uncharacterized protein n=1 Tax=Lomentospora prolificans TaxID=41688 RepID=A0A2N3N9B0_9PEZI|nr:hypothetical protein jhhlp_003642 [Lomentospora prolificans]
MLPPKDGLARRESGDIERQDAYALAGDTLHGIASFLHLESGDVYTMRPEKNSKWYQKLLDLGIEENGIKPVPVELRTQTKYSDIFTVFFSCLLNILPIPTGAMATITFGLSLKESALIILFFAVLTSIPPAFIGVGGYKTGMRQMVQARYSFGLYLVTIPILFNAATLTGFSLMSAIFGGQTLAVVNPGANISVNTGIVVVCILSFFASFLGYNAVHLWERYQWIPNLIALFIMVGCSHKELYQQRESPSSDATRILSYGGLMAGYFLTFGGTVSDYSIYHKPTTAKKRIFSYLMLAFITPSVPLLVFGAAIGGALPNAPPWQRAFESHGIGGVLAEILAPLGGFGKVILVMLALSIIGNVSISMYSISLCLQMILPIFANVHRFIWVTVTMAVMVPLALKTAESWEVSLTNYLALIGYWAGCFDAVVVEELVIFRKMDWSTFDHSIWNVGRSLPTGIPAVVASLISLSLVVPGMETSLYTGPIAEKTGDIGFIVAVFTTGLFYIPLRWFEIRWRGHL